MKQLGKLQDTWVTWVMAGETSDKPGYIGLHLSTWGCKLRQFGLIHGSPKRMSHGKSITRTYVTIEQFVSRDDWRTRDADMSVDMEFGLPELLMVDACDLLCQEDLLPGQRR